MFAPHHLSPRQQVFGPRRLGLVTRAYHRAASGFVTCTAKGVGDRVTQSSWIAGRASARIGSVVNQGIASQADSPIATRIVEMFRAGEGIGCGTGSDLDARYPDLSVRSDMVEDTPWPASCRSSPRYGTREPRRASRRPGRARRAAPS